MEINKLPEWEVNLAKYLTKEFNLPFEWGVRDCTTFVIGALQSMTEKHLIVPEFTYRTKEEAIAFSATYSLYEGMLEQLNAYLVNPHFQQPGDIIFVWENEVYPCVHLCNGEKSLSAIPDYGVRAFPTSLVIREGLKHKIRILRFD